MQLEGRAWPATEARGQEGSPEPRANPLSSAKSGNPISRHRAASQVAHCAQGGTAGKGGTLCGGRRGKHPAGPGRRPGLGHGGRDAGSEMTKREASSLILGVGLPAPSPRPPPGPCRGGCAESLPAGWGGRGAHGEPRRRDPLLPQQHVKHVSIWTIQFSPGSKKLAIDGTPTNTHISTTNTIVDLFATKTTESPTNPTHNLSQYLISAPFALSKC